MVNRMRQITDLGQAIWLDFISRDLLRSSQLRELIKEGVTGVTSNPSILQKAIAGGSAYDDQLRELARAGRNAYEIYEALAFRDIAEAADQLRPIYHEKDGRDGFVSIEVDPKLAHDSEQTIAEARRIFQTIDRPNTMIKVPATEAGISAVRTLIGEGINVNATLVFAIQTYEQVIEAYLDGLKKMRGGGRPIHRVASVASFFVSRIDTLVDQHLTERIEAGEQTLATLRGQAAMASAKIAYERYQNAFESDRFAELRAAGARVQRPVWASTSTKNPTYSDTKYVDTLIGPNTVNTLPPNTLDAFRDHGTAVRTIDLDVEEAYAVIERLITAGIDMQTVTDQLLEEGVRKFADSFDQMIADIDAKRAKFA